MPDDFELSPKVKIEGRELDHVWAMSLVDVQVALEYQVAGRVTLRFVDPGFELASSQKMGIGKVVTVFAPNERDDALVEAEITAVAVDQRAGEVPELVVTAYDRSHRLGRGTSVATYVNMTFADIVSDLASKHGMTATVGSTKIKLDYLLQVDSDLALLGELAARCGFDWWVEGKVLHFDAPKAKTSPDLSVTLGEGLTSLSVRASAVQPTKVEVRGWERGQQMAVNGQTTTGNTVVATSDIADLANKAQSAFGAATLVAASLIPLSNDEARQLSAAHAGRVRHSAVSARGVIVPGTGKVKLGGLVKVEKAGPMSGSYPVTKVEHVYRPRTGFETRFTSGDRTPTTLVDTLARPATTASATFRHPGLVPGQVTNINDPDKLGRVKVKYPGLSESAESAWARIVAVGGGKKRGTVFIPEVNDEVLLGFEGGDLRQPVVLGGLYGSKSGIPSWNVADGKVTSRKMTSRLGHVVELADGQQDPDQFILLSLAGEKHKFRIGKDRADLEMPSGKPVSIKAGNTKVEFAADGSVTIHGSNITIKADQKISLQAAQVEIKASAQLDVQTNGTAAIKGAITNVEANGPLALKGGIVQIN